MADSEYVRCLPDTTIRYIACMHVEVDKHGQRTDVPLQGWRNGCASDHEKWWQGKVTRWPNDEDEWQEEKGERTTAGNKENQ